MLIPRLRALASMDAAGLTPTWSPKGAANRPVPTPMSSPSPCSGTKARKASSSLT